MSAKDLYRFRVITGVALSPDEKRIAYTVERMDETDRKYYTNIFMLNTASRESRQFTHGNHNDGQPAWSHSGEHLAFVSTREKKTGIYIMPVGGGAEKKLLEVEGSISDLQWTPDDRHLVFDLQYADSHFVEDEKKKKEPPVYRHITRLFFRLDGLGRLQCRARPAGKIITCLQGRPRPRGHRCGEQKPRV